MNCCVYQVGGAVLVRAKPKDGAVTDASSWRLLVAGPDDTQSTAYTMTAEDGFAIATFTPDRSGRWRYRIEVSSPVPGSAEGSVEVKTRTVPPPAP